MDRTLQTIYYDPAHPGGLGSVAKLRNAVREQTGIMPQLSKVNNFLLEQDVYTLHAKAAINFPRNRVLVRGIDQQFQADLVDMIEYSEENDNVRYLLMCIDVFSKYAWVRCLSNKSAASVTNAFKDVLNEGRVPVKLQTDEGTEFYNKKFQQLMDQYKIKHFSTSNETKASIIERFNRTFKTRMWRYLTSVNSRRYVEVVQDLVNAYNNSHHRSINMTPSTVDKNNEKIVFMHLYKLKPQKPLVFKFSKGDNVRISKLRGVFRKGYKQTFTDEHFIISECLSRDPPVYKLSDSANDPVRGTFYEGELHKVIIGKNKTFKIESVLTRKKHHGKNMVFVKWLGWPQKFNTWIPEKDMVPV